MYLLNMLIFYKEIEKNPKNCDANCVGWGQGEFGSKLNFV